MVFLFVAKRLRIRKRTAEEEIVITVPDVPEVDKKGKETEKAACDSGKPDKISGDPKEVD